MPIFQDPDHQGSIHGQWPPNYSCGNSPQASIYAGAGTEDVNDETMSSVSPGHTKMDSSNLPRLETSDREELIWRIKQGESPTWVPNRSVSGPVYLICVRCYSNPHSIPSMLSSFQAIQTILVLFLSLFFLL